MFKRPQKGEPNRSTPLPIKLPRVAGADPGQGPGDVEAPTVVGQPQGKGAGRSPDNLRYRVTGTRPW
jgi:hypothetical protein